MGFQGTRRSRRPARGGMIAALDVGSTSVVCCIARVESGGELRVIGLGHQISQGVRAGAIVDMEAAETCIGAALHGAEQMAGETIRSVFVTMSGGRPQSSLMPAEVAVHGAEVTEADVRRAMAQARAFPVPPEVTVLHAIPVGFTLDGQRDIDDPVGMVGDRLGVTVNVVTAHQGAVRNLRTCVSRCHLDIEGMVTSPYASALSSLADDEMALGATCIDMGGGTTTISVFSRGHLVAVDSLPVGGQHVTADLAVGLGTTLTEAERLKTLFGNTMPGVTDDREMLDVRQIGEEHRPGGGLPKSMLVRIIRPRMEEIFEMVRAHLTQSGHARLAGRRVVLTGGASQLPGAAELARKMLDKQVRVGRPTRVSGLADAHGGPSYAAIAGLLHHAMHSPAELPVVVPENNGGLLSRVGVWLREYL